MSYYSALGAAIGAALSNGAAANLEKVSAARQDKATNLDPRLFLRLLGNTPYLIGIILDCVAWILTIVAVRELPLFFVQSIIAASIVITALLDHWFLGQRLSKHIGGAIGLILGGLLLLAIAATPDHAKPVNGSVHMTLLLLPLVIAAIGAWLVRAKGHGASVAIAALSGIGFGTISVVGRVMVIPSPWWHILASPNLYAMAGYGLVSILLFTISLQRNSATTANASMTALETLAPTLAGIILLGDTPRQGLWWAVILGAALALSGTLWLAINAHPNRAKTV